MNSAATTTRSEGPAWTTRPRRRIPRALMLDMCVDTFLLVAFVANESFRLTGLVIHEWVGATLAIALLAHITLHWDWTVRTTRRLIAKRPGRDTIRWTNDLLLMVAMTICVASGLLSSRVVLPTFGLAEGSSDFWLEVHLWTARFCLFFVGLHVALSWRWIISVAQRVPRPRLRKGTP
jgi:hypothetical protein